MLRTDDASSLALPDDDLVLPFRTVRSDVVGRVIRLGSVVDTILSRHAYPEPVSHALGQALALTAMLGTALKSESKLILQTKTDGPLDFLVADFVAPGKLRGYASFDKADAHLAETKGCGDQGALLGKGHVAMTIDPGDDKNRYQGVVPLEHEPLGTPPTPIPAIGAAPTFSASPLPAYTRMAAGAATGVAAGGLISSTCPAGGQRPSDATCRTITGNWTRARHLARRGGPPAARSDAVARRLLSGSSTMKACGTPATR